MIEENGVEKSSSSIPKCIGSGFAECQDELSYNSLLEAEIFYEGRKLEISPFLEKSELENLHQEMNLRKIMVKYLPNNTENEDLENLFKIFGKLVNAFVSSDKKNSDQEFPSNYGIVIYKERKGALLALNGKILVKGNPVVVRLHRFRRVREGIFDVAGIELDSEDLLNIQIGRKKKIDLTGVLDEGYGKMAEKWDDIEARYEELLRFDRKKLKKECKRKKDKSLKKILFQMEKEERIKLKAKNDKNGGENKNKKKKRKRNKKKKGLRKSSFKSPSRPSKNNEAIGVPLMAAQYPMLPHRSPHPAYPVPHSPYNHQIHYSTAKKQQMSPQVINNPQSNNLAARLNFSHKKGTNELLRNSKEKLRNRRQNTNSGFKLVPAVNYTPNRELRPGERPHMGSRFKDSEETRKVSYRSYVYSQGSNSMTDDELWNWSKVSPNTKGDRLSNQENFSGLKLNQMVMGSGEKLESTPLKNLNQVGFNEKEAVN